jgi:hypothetical protein
VVEGWQIKVVGSPMFVLYARLKVVKKILYAKSLEVFGGIKERATLAKEKMYCAQRIV